MLPQAGIEMSSFHYKYISEVCQMKGVDEEKITITFWMRLKHVDSGNRLFSNMAAMKISQNKLFAHIMNQS